MPGHVHDIVDAAEQPEVAVFVSLCTVTRKILARESAPVSLHETIRVTIDGTHHRGPRLGQNQITPAALGNGFSLLVDDIGFDPGKRQRRGTRFELRQSWQRCDQGMAGLSLPPGGHYRPASAADSFVIPDPSFRIDRLADSPQKSQALEVVLSWKLRPPTHEGPNGRRRGMENRYAIFLDDAPQTVFVRPVRSPFIHHLCHSVSHGTVDDVRVPGHPADVRCAPEDIVLLHVENPLIRQMHARKISAGGMDDAFRFPGGAAG